jgi:hypothetical protein
MVGFVLFCMVFNISYNCHLIGFMSFIVFILGSSPI